MPSLMNRYYLQRTALGYSFTAIFVDNIIKFFMYVFPLSFTVSHEVPEHPVVSPSSNHVFEKRLIEKYIAENGVDPISQEPLTVEQLIDIKGLYISKNFFTIVKCIVKSMLPKDTVQIKAKGGERGMGMGAESTGVIGTVAIVVLRHSLKERKKPSNHFPPSKKNQKHCLKVPRSIDM